MEIRIVKRVKPFHKLLFVEMVDYRVLELHGQFYCDVSLNPCFMP
jgi:hypothetical protein